MSFPNSLFILSRSSSLFKPTLAFNLVNKTSSTKLRHLAHFRCNVENPINHSIDHEAMFYNVPSTVQQQLFSYGGLQSNFLTTVKTFNECSVMIRKPFLELRNYIQAADYSTPVIKYIIYGRKEVGKTLCVAHLMHYASLTGWLIVHVPWAPLWVRKFKEVIPSQSRPGRFDQPHEGVVWLQQFKTQNLQLLEKLDLKTTQAYEWSKRETTEQGASLIAVIEHGLNRPKHSNDCIAVLLKELKLYASSGKVKVFVAIDGVNALFHQTRAKRDDKSPILSDEITLVHAFRKFTKSDWCNGVIVGIVDELASAKDRKESHLPLYLLGKEGFEHFDPFVPVLINNYTEKEIHSCLDYYIDRLWIQNQKGKTEEGRKELIFLSGYNPGKLIKLCAAW